MVTKGNIPHHVAIIMDGNGRWAKERGLQRTAGHKQGINRVKEIVKAAGKMGIRVLTLFAFSCENWSRPKEEVDMLMRYLGNFLGRYVKELDENNIRLKVIGQDRPIPASLVQKIKLAQEKTKGNTGLTLVLALNYGSRQEIAQAAKELASQVKAGSLRLEDIDVGEFQKHLFTAGIPDPDLLIRTSNELRLSNFLLWQLSYAELYFTRKFWPDFKEEDLQKAVAVYQARERRFGGINAK